VGTRYERAQVAFAQDPYAWFEHVRAELLEQRNSEILGAIEPESWTSENGHAWRVVRTDRGVEIRPDLTRPFLRLNDSPKVTAIAIHADAVEVELSAKSARWVDRFEVDAFDVAALGRAMLDEHELPHDNLGRLFPVRR
jgi:hypothetical protein